MASSMARTKKRPVSAAALERIWGSGGYRIFISHKTEAKTTAAGIKSSLSAFGASCFVAHEDIHPAREWQDEIENALGSMDAFLALLTKRFHESDWTDQEVGFALGASVPIIALKLERNPYGFIAKFQALKCSVGSAPLEIVKLLVGQPRMREAYVGAVEECRSFNHGNLLAEVLPSVKKLTGKQAKRLVAAFNSNSELSGSFGFRGSKPHVHGDGLAAHLRRITKSKFVLAEDNQIRSLSKKRSKSKKT